MIAVSMLVPGVSGATMMITFDVYELALEFLDNLTRGKLVHKKTILHLLIGGLIGLIGFSQFMLFILGKYGFWVRYFFFGSILYGLFDILKIVQLKNLKMRHFLLMIVGVFTAMGLQEFETGHFVSNNPDFFLVIIRCCR